MKIDYLSIDKLKPYKLNAKEHPEDQIQGLSESIKQFGFTQPIVIDEENNIIVGHGRLEAAKIVGLIEVPTLMLNNLTEDQVKAYRIIDNKIAESPWNLELLTLSLDCLEFNFDPFNIDLPDIESLPEQEVDDSVPEVLSDAITKIGDIWVCGDHRIMCGDSTSITDVDKLIGDKKIALLHADPPYGMGKENEGVLNDNLYNQSLDKFNMDWITCAYPSLISNASIYIWGNAPDLWRLWFEGGLKEIPGLNVPSEIVWSKIHSGGSFDAIGQKSHEMKMFPVASERCLFIKRGCANSNNNSDNYWEGWDPIRSYLSEQLKIAEKEQGGKWNFPFINKITGTHMGSHWFSKSQWCMIPEGHYMTLRETSQNAAFLKDYHDLKREYLQQKKIYSGEEVDNNLESKTWFDNSHDVMADVWEFERVKGEDREGHSTPKPLKLMERVLKTSCPAGSICYEPFGGSGTTLAAAQITGRICYTMELSPQYCDVIVKRWQKISGLKAINLETRDEFNSPEC